MKTVKSTLTFLAAGAALFFMSCGQASHEEHKATDSAATSQNEQTPTVAAASLNLTIDGMSCENCATALKEAISTIAGVTTCNVDYPNKTASVQYDNTKTNQEAILTQVTTTHDGKFKATVVSEPMAELTGGGGHTACDKNCTKPCCSGKEGEEKKCSKNDKDCCKKDASAEKKECSKEEEKKGCCKKDATHEGCKETEKK